MYRIVITKEEDVVSTVQEWMQIYDTSDDAKAAGQTGSYGYADKKVEQVKETKMLDQRVEELNLDAVIIAVNNLNGTKPAKEHTDGKANTKTEA